VNPADTRRDAVASVLLCATLPALWLGDTLHPHTTPAIEGAGLWQTLREAATWRSGATDGPWPRAPLPTLLEALLPADPALAHGIVTVFAVWLAGFGAWQVARVRAGASLPACAAIALLAQTSPTVLRGVPGADLAALGVGALLLAVAFPRHAWWAGAWSAPVAGTLAGLGALRALLARGDAAARAEARALALGGVTLLGLLLPGGTDTAPPALAPAYVTPSGAVFPLPEAEAAPVRATALATGTGTWLAPGVAPTARGNVFVPAPTTPGDARSSAADDTSALPAWGVLLVPAQRVHGGLVVVLGGVLGVCLGRRRWWGAATLTALAALSLAIGWQASPGEVERGARAVEALRGWLSADTRTHGLALSVVPLALGILAIADVASGLAARGRTARVLAVLLAGMVAMLGVLLENPRLVAFRTMLPPDPALAVLRTGAPGDVLVFPPPQRPWHAGSVAADRIEAELSIVGRRLATPSADTDAAILALAQRADIPVDVQAARVAWEVRSHEPFAPVPSPAWRWLLVDTSGLPSTATVALDGWLAARVGLPISRSATRILYDRDALAMAPGGPRSAPLTPHAVPGGAPVPPVPERLPAPR
jgi:hypothetical protein